MSARSGWIGRQKTSRGPLGPSHAIFSMDRKHQQKCSNFAYFPWWAKGPYSPGLGSRAGVISSLLPFSNFPSKWQGLQEAITRNQIPRGLESKIRTPNTKKAHWPTKENRHLILHFLHFRVHGKNHQMAPNRARRNLFLLIQTLPTFWAERI